jgi:hypothetical protein
LSYARATTCGLASPLPVNRITIKMEPGDEALVFRLVLPPGTPRIDPKDKGAIAQHVKAGQLGAGAPQTTRMI